MTKPKRDWKKIKYYPVSIEKLKQASMKEVAYLIAPVNIGEDYEYFDEVKHLLEVPEPRKTLEEIQNEFNDKIDNLIVKTQRKFLTSQQSAEYRFNQFCRQQNYIFETLIASGTTGLLYSISATNSGNIVCAIDSGLSWQKITPLTRPNDVGFYCITPDFSIGTSQKPSRFFRVMTRILLGWKWKDA